MNQLNVSELRTTTPSEAYSNLGDAGDDDLPF